MSSISQEIVDTESRIWYTPSRIKNIILWARIKPFKNLVLKMNRLHSRYITCRLKQTVAMDHGIQSRCLVSTMLSVRVGCTVLATAAWGKFIAASQPQVVTTTPACQNITSSNGSIWRLHAQLTGRISPASARGITKNTALETSFSVPSKAIFKLDEVFLLLWEGESCDCNYYW